MLETLTNTGSTNILLHWAKPVYWLITIYIWLVIIRIIISWFGVNFNKPSPFVKILKTLTDKPLAISKSIFPKQMGIFDLSPILLLFFLNFLRIFFLFFLIYYGKTSSWVVVGPALSKAIIMCVQSLFWLVTIILGIRILLPLIKANPYNPIVQIIYNLTEPLLKPFSFLPRYRGLLDLRALAGIIVTVAFVFFIFPHFDNLIEFQAFKYINQSQQIAPAWPEQLNKFY